MRRHNNSIFFLNISSPHIRLFVPKFTVDALMHHFPSTKSLHRHDKLFRLTPQSKHGSHRGTNMKITTKMSHLSCLFKIYSKHVRVVRPVSCRVNAAVHCGEAEGFTVAGTLWNYWKPLEFCERVCLWRATCKATFFFFCFFCLFVVLNVRTWPPSSGLKCLSVNSLFSCTVERVRIMIDRVLSNL